MTLSEVCGGAIGKSKNFIARNHLIVNSQVDQSRRQDFQASAETGPPCLLDLQSQMDPEMLWSYLWRTCWKRFTFCPTNGSCQSWPGSSLDITKIFLEFILLYTLLKYQGIFCSLKCVICLYLF